MHSSALMMPLFIVVLSRDVEFLGRIAIFSLDFGIGEAGFQWSLCINKVLQTLCLSAISSRHAPEFLSV